jgi:very-short-patch-repair endonuclease
MQRSKDPFTNLLDDGGPSSRSLSELMADFDIDAFVRNRRLRQGYDESKTMGDKWGHIRQVWQEHMPTVMAAPADQWVDPYFVDWDFSRAESATWSALRSSTHIAPLYPQVPVFNWFVDFGNPRRRVGLEVDGKQWHTPEKDRERDQQLWSQDWRIFRVPAREFLSDDSGELWQRYEERCEWLRSDGRDPQEESDPEILEIAEAYMLTTGNGVVEAIAAQYFRAKLEWPFDRFILATLSHHRLVDFAL